MTNKDSLEFHIRSEDLFGTFATEIDLLRQDAEAHGYTRKHDAALQRVRDDLIYLQRGFRVIERNHAAGEEVAAFVGAGTSNAKTDKRISRFASLG